MKQLLGCLSIIAALSLSACTTAEQGELNKLGKDSANAGKTLGKDGASTVDQLGKDGKEALNKLGAESDKAEKSVANKAKGAGSGGDATAGESSPKSSLKNNMGAAGKDLKEAGETVENVVKNVGQAAKNELDKTEAKSKEKH